MIEGVGWDAVSDLLRKAVSHVKAMDYRSLKELSDDAISSASVHQDEVSVSIAVLIYAASKLIERCSVAHGKKGVCLFIGKHIEKAIKYLDMRDEKRFMNSLKALFDEISKADEKFKVYIGTVVEKARLKKGSMMYGSGVSLARSADILGISQWELMRYVGRVDITVLTGKIGVEKRLNFARGLFNL